MLRAKSSLVLRYDGMEYLAEEGSLVDVVKIFNVEEENRQTIELRFLDKFPLKLVKEEPKEKINSAVEEKPHEDQKKKRGRPKKR